MKRLGFLKRRTPLSHKSGRLRARADNETNRIKDDIQATVRAIVIARDGGCVLQPTKRMVVPTAKDMHAGYTVPPCNGYAKDGHLILQADHLITRANAATFTDTRLIVCVCKGHHGWKSLGGNARKAQYDAIVKQLLPRDRVELWERAEQDSWRPHRNFTYDWKVELAALKQELRQLNMKTIATGATF